MKSCRILIFTLGLVLFSPALSLAEQTHFEFGSSQTWDTFTYRFQTSVLKEAFRRMGCTVEVSVIPEKDKLIRMVQSGELDGDSARVKEFGAGHPGYVLVDAPTFSLEQNVYATKDYAISGWDSIYALNLETGYTIGAYASEKMLIGKMDKAKLHGFTKRLDGFNALASGEIDLYVMIDQYTAAEFMALPRFQQAGIHPVATLRRGDAYVYFAEKHREMAPKLARVLQHMQREALFEQFIREAMSR